MGKLMLRVSKKVAQVHTDRPFPNPVFLASLGTALRAGLSELPASSKEEAPSLLEGSLAEGPWCWTADSILRLP